MRGVQRRSGPLSVIAAVLLAACGGASTPDDAAKAYADAYTRGDGGAVYDMLALEERAMWDRESRALTGPGSRRERFAAFIEGVWGTDRGTARVVDLQVDGDQATATLATASEPIPLRLRREEGVWRVSLFMPARR